MNNKNKVTDKKKNIFIEDIQQSTNERKTTQITIRSFIFFHTFLFIFFRRERHQRERELNGYEQCV